MTEKTPNDANKAARENQTRLNQSVEVTKIRGLETELMNVRNLVGTFYPEDRSANGFVILQASAEELAKPIAERIPPTALRHYYGFKDGKYHDDLYLKSGRQDAATIRKIVTEDGFQLKGERILEFGCSAGRILRNFEEEAKAGEAWGVDLHSAAIHWAQTHLTPFNFFTNTTAPHLPFESNHFGLIFAGSVWTHIGEMDDAWLLEIRRVLRPGGRAYITISDTNTLAEVKRLSPDHASNQHVQDLDDATGMMSKDYVQFVTRTTPWLQRVVYNREQWVKRISKWMDVKSFPILGYEARQTLNKRELGRTNHSQCGRGG